MLAASPSDLLGLMSDSQVGLTYFVTNNARLSRQRCYLWLKTNVRLQILEVQNSLVLHQCMLVSKHEPAVCAGIVGFIDKNTAS